jgi:serine phosphatase RsbU (regulator of sigma subunit)
MTADRDGTLPAPDYPLVVDLAPVSLLLITPDLVVVHANREWLAATATVGSPDGRKLVDVLAPRPGDPEADGSLALLAALVRARDTRSPDTTPAQRFDVVLPDGGFLERWWDYRTVPILDEGGNVVLLVHRADDVTGRVLSGAPARTGTRELEDANAELRALGERQRRTADALAGLATTVSALAGAESRSDLLTQLFRHGRPALGADLLAVALLESGGAQLAVVDTRGPGSDGPRTVPARSPLPMAVAAAGRPVFEVDADPASSTAAPFPGLRAWAALPLRAGRQPLGSVLVGWNTAQGFGEDDVRVLEAFAAQCSQAVTRVARLEAERRRGHATRGLAETLQRSLLTDPPRQPQFDIAVRYRPAAREAQVGGDWYDAFLSAPGETTLVVGDVTGHDWTAAAVAGQLRNMLRGITAALDGEHLGRVLAALDRALRDTGLRTLATALVARVVEPPASAPARPRTLLWSNAGHPPPVLVEPGGTAHLLERPSDLLLGVDPDARRHEHTVALRPGATLVLYTDGLVERRDATLDDGLDRLLAAAADVAARPVDEVCDEIIGRLDPELTDDIALLALRVRGPVEIGQPAP